MALPPVPEPQAAALDRLRDLFRQDKATVSSRLSEWFYTYHSDLYVHGVPFEIYVRKVARIIGDLGQPRFVLDVGAGFGVYSCLLRILGVSRVVAMDYHAQKARDAAALVRYLGLDGVTVLHGDALAFPFKGRLFDGALTLACLSHIREPEQALRNLADLLQPGGRVYVFEDNNSSFPGYEKQMSKIWEAAESGIYDEGIPSEKQRAESYLAIRKDLIRAKFPDLSPDAVDHCARETRGLYGRHIEAAVDTYRQGKPIQNPRRRFACNPVSGEFEEYPLNPALVKEMLRHAGFDPSLRSPHTGPFRGRSAILKRAAAGILRAFPFLLPWTSATFSVVGTLSEPKPR